MEPVTFSGFDKDTGEITVHNKYDLRICPIWKEPSGSIHCREFYWKEKQIWAELPLTAAGALRCMTRRLQRTGQRHRISGSQYPYASEKSRSGPKKEHYEAAFHQECIKEAEPAAHPVSEGTESGGLCLTEKCGTIYIEGKNFTAEFDRIHGYLSGYTVTGSA